MEFTREGSTSWRKYFPLVHGWPEYSNYATSKKGPADFQCMVLTSRLPNAKIKQRRQKRVNKG
jgi:hypothetical protein